MLVYVTGAGLLAARLTSWPVTTALAASLAAAAFMAAAGLLGLALAFSSGTNDTARLRRAVPLILCFVFFGVGSLLMARAGIYASPPAAALLWLLAVLNAYVLLRVYGVFYNRMHFDLLTMPKQ
jgi:hypothetical protein